MKKVLLITFCIAQLISHAGVTIYDSIYSGGLWRKYRLYVPTVYTGATAVPLVLNLHGYTSNSAQQLAYANFMPIADTANFLVVHPDGTFSGPNQFWNAGFGPAPNDVMFISNLIDSVSLLYNIDQQRVYSCGMSNGGIMSYYMACNLPNKIAAIASVTGSMLNLWFTCAPVRPFPVMEIHGTLDATVLYNGDATFAHIDSVVKKWRVHNNCNVAPITYSVPNINLLDNSTAVNYRYTGGNNGAEVELYKVTGGSHSWPGSFPIIANTNLDFSASVEIWRFFRKYRLNVLTTNINSLQSELNKLNVFPNPSNETVNVSGIENAELKIFSMDGREIMSKKQTNSIWVQELECGIYFLKISKGTESATVKFIKN